MYENQYLSTVLAPQGFVRLCTSGQCEPPRASYSVAGARPPGLCTSVYFSAVRVPPAFVRCEPTKALYSVRQSLCFCVLYDRQELYAVRAYNASVYRTSAKSFARCERTKTLCLCVLYEPHELFGVSPQRLYTVCARLVLLCTVRASRALCGTSLQRLYTVCWCSPLKLCTECLCARAVV